MVFFVVIFDEYREILRRSQPSFVSLANEIKLGRKRLGMRLGGEADYMSSEEPFPVEWSAAYDHL